MQAQQLYRKCGRGGYIYINHAEIKKCALLDISKAFDLVDHGLLFELLLKRNLPCSVTCFLLQLYSSLASFPGSPFLFFVGARGEPGNEANSSQHLQIGGMLSFLHLYLHQMVFDRVESYLQSCLQITLMNFCSICKILVWFVIGKGCLQVVFAMLIDDFALLAPSAGALNLVHIRCGRLTNCQVIPILISSTRISKYYFISLVLFRVQLPLWFQTYQVLL